MKKYFVSAAIWLRSKLSKFLETEQDRQFRTQQKKLEEGPADQTGQEVVNV